MKIEDQIPLLKKLMAFKTPEQQQAFMEGLEYQIPQQTKSEQASAPPAEKQAPLPASVPLRVDAPSPSRNGKVRSRGLRAKVLRLLYTGPCREAELAGHCSPEELHALRSTLRRLEIAGRIAESQGMYVLTTLGRPESKFFIDHPTLIVHNDKSDKRTS